MKNYFNTIKGNSGLWIALKNTSLESLLKEAKELEKNYEWLQAAEIYRKASNLSLDDEDSFKVAELQERTGFCFNRAAFQVKTTKEYHSRINKAIEVYKQAISSYNLSKKEGKKTKIIRNKAKILHLKSLVTTGTSKKEELFNEYLKLEKKALENYKKSSDYLDIGRVCNDIMEKRINRILFESTWERVRDSIDEIDKVGMIAINALSKVNDDYELARTYSLIIKINRSPFKFGLKSPIELKKEIGRIRKALKLSEKIEDAYLLFRNNGMAIFAAWLGQNNVAFALEFAEKAAKYADLTHDTLLLARAKQDFSIITCAITLKEEDPDKQKEGFEKSFNIAQEAIRKFHLVNNFHDSLEAYRGSVESLTWLASIETNPDVKRSILEKAIRIGYEGVKYNKGCTGISAKDPLGALSIALYNLSTIETKISKKRYLLNQALKYREKVNKVLQEVAPQGRFLQSRSQNYLALIQAELAKIEIKKEKKIVLLKTAVSTMEKSLKLTKKGKIYDKGVFGIWTGEYNFRFGGILNELYLLTKDEKLLIRAIEAYKDAAKYFDEEELISRSAEVYWRIAKLYDLFNNNLEASANYEIASKSYELAAKKIPQLEDFYKDYSSYMKAWSHIEQARYSHSIEEYNKAQQQYAKAAELHELSNSWNYLAPNYFAWAKMEKAEGLSRKESTQQSKQAFQKALEQFSKAEESIKQKIEKITSTDEKEMTQNLFQASDQRRKYCQTRILVEDAKLLDREGKYLQSSKSYREAAQNIETIIKKIDVETERKELKYVAILCQAWEKMAIAEETTSSDSYLDAATLFEQAKEHCFTKKASLWALGNSSFCRGLAAKTQFQRTFKKSYHSMANKHMKLAADYYKRAGFHTASEYAKATQRLFDAYLYMNSAEEEVDPEKKTRYYQLSEQLLEIAAGLFVKAKQPEKTALVQSILATVREEKALAVSLNDVMHAPTITSSTMSFTAPSPTSEVSVGLEQFQHANVQASLIAGLKEVKVGESFCLSVEFVNAGKEPALLMRVEDFVPPDFIVAKKPEIYRIEETCLNMKGKQIAPLKLVEAKLVLQPAKKGVYNVKPTVHYLDELGQTKSLQLKAVEIKVEEVILADRISTGTKELDSLLLGGIPEGYAVVLTGSPSDEREYLIKNFLETGVQEGQTSFYVTAETVGFESLFEKLGFYLFLCNPKPKKAVPDLPNITWLKSKTDLNNLNMALVRASRNVQQKKGIKRIVIRNVSDVLLKDGPEVTRRWLSELVTDLGSKGFTILAVLDSSMHPVDQANAIINSFDGEISLTQAEDTFECKKSVVVKKLRSQDFIKNSICLTKSK